VGHLNIDPHQFPREPWLRDLISELARRVDGTIDLMCGRRVDGTPVCGQYRVRAEGVTEKELARLWEEVRAEHRRSPRWGAGERKKRQAPRSRRTRP
jgi:hypothetical protein